MSHAIWGGGDTVVDDERLDKTPGTTIPQQAKSALSAKIDGYKSRASRKTTPMKVGPAGVFVTFVVFRYLPFQEVDYPLSSCNLLNLNLTFLVKIN